MVPRRTSVGGLDLAGARARARGHGLGSGGRRGREAASAHAALVRRRGRRAPEHAAPEQAGQDRRDEEAGKPEGGERRSHRADTGLRRAERAEEGSEPAAPAQAGRLCRIQAEVARRCGGGREGAGGRRDCDEVAPEVGAGGAGLEEGVGADALGIGEIAGGVAGDQLELVVGVIWVRKVHLAGGTRSGAVRFPQRCATVAARRRAATNRAIPSARKAIEPPSSATVATPWVPVSRPPDTGTGFFVSCPDASGPKFVPSIVDVAGPLPSAPGALVGPAADCALNNEPGPPPSVSEPMSRPTTPNVAIAAPTGRPKAATPRSRRARQPSR